MREDASRPPGVRRAGDAEEEEEEGDEEDEPPGALTIRVSGPHTIEALFICCQFKGGGWGGWRDSLDTCGFNSSCGHYVIIIDTIYKILYHRVALRILHTIKNFNGNDQKC